MNRLYTYPVFGAQDPAKIFAPLSTTPYSLFFDSADSGHALSRYSYIAYAPFEMIESKNGHVTVTNRTQQLSFISNPFDVIRNRMETYEPVFQARDDLPPFQGGAAGFFGYDLGRDLETITPHATDNPDMPDMAVGLYDRVFVYDHEKKSAFLIVHAAHEKDAKEKYAHFEKLISSGHGYRHKPLPDAKLDWSSSHTAKSYRDDVQTIIDYIYAGDIFQANLSQRFDAALPRDFAPYAHYLNLRAVNPAPFASFMNFGNVILASASPERFLQIGAGRRVETRPIKGTHKRAESPDMDALYREKLLTSVKDRAENVMIVDLLRNDISKVCEDFSVHVDQLCGVESFAGLHHLVSIIKGTLRADYHPADLMAACFPGGSITGAPKIRAMEIIETLEKTRRGAYCGAMGYIGFNGMMDTNITIRTLVYQGQKVSFQAGGGITAQSDPEAEYQETLTKAQAIFKSFAPKSQYHDIYEEYVA